MTVFIISAVIALAYIAYRLVQRAHARHAREQREADADPGFGNLGEPLKRQPRSTWNDEDQR